MGFAAMVSVVRYILIMWICAGFGMWVLKRLLALSLPNGRATDITLAEQLPFGAAIGMGVLSYLILTVGLLHQIHLWPVLIVLALLAAVGCREMVGLARRLPAAFTRVAPRGGATPVAIFLLTIFLLTLIGALAPATDSDYDSLVYHLTIPKIYVQEGSIHLIPWLTHSNFPFTMEMLYTLGLLVNDQSLAKLFSWGCGWLAALAIFGFTRRWFTPRGVVEWRSLAGWLGAAIFVGVPLLTWQAMTAYVELALALYTFLALAALARVLGQERSPALRGWLWVAALMCGWAMGVKMLGGVVFVFALAVVSLHASRSTLHARRIIAFALIAAAVASPWYIKSYLWTGNPVYPFLYELFDGRFWTADRARAYTEAQKAFGMGGGPLSFLLLPWNLTMHPRWFFDLPGTVRPFNTYITAFGPVFLVFLPTLAVTGRIGLQGRLILWFALTFGALWFVSTQNGRYLIPILPGLSACCGVAAARLLRRGWLASSSAVLTLTIGLLSGLVAAYLLAAPAARVVLGMESRYDYLMRVSPTYHLMHAVEEATPPSARIMLFGDEPRTFYLSRDCLLGDHAELFSRDDLSTGTAFLAALRHMGVTHLLLGASIVHNMHVQSGLIETRLSDLALSGVIRPVGQYDSTTLWVIRDKASRSAG